MRERHGGATNHPCLMAEMPGRSREVNERPFMGVFKRHRTTDMGQDLPSSSRPYRCGSLHSSLQSGRAAYGQFHQSDRADKGRPWAKRGDPVGFLVEICSTTAAPTEAHLTATDADWLGAMRGQKRHRSGERLTRQLAAVQRLFIDLIATRCGELGYTRAAACWGI